MGRFKLTLPWGKRTVIAQVVCTLEAAGVAEIVVVTGHRAGEVAAALAGSAARCGHNPDYETGEMLCSIQAGLRALAARPQAALLCLGDQPQMQADTVRAVLEAGAAADWRPIIIPSHQMRGGHPILLPAWLWPEILSAQDTLRTVLSAHRDRITYVSVDTPTVLADLDTPEDYDAARMAGH